MLLSVGIPCHLWPDVEQEGHIGVRKNGTNVPVCYFKYQKKEAIAPSWLFNVQLANFQFVAWSTP